MQKKITSVILFFALIFSSVLSLVSIYRLEGNARIINYTGIVRGSTQRLVVRELNGAPDDLLIEKTDRIVEELQTGRGENGLSRLDSRQYQELMAQVQDNWENLKKEIYLVRAGGDGKSLFAASEDFFRLADEAVTAAEAYTDRQVFKAQRSLAAASGVFLLLAGVFYLYTLKQDKRQRALQKIEEESQRKNRDLTRMSESLRMAMDDISELMYVADIETSELLFINEAGRKTFHVDSLGQGKCHQILQGKDAPCEFCTSPLLKEGETYTWEYDNPLSKRHYLLKDRLIQWDGRQARLEIAFDTTEMEAEKLRLKFTLDAEKMITECVRTLYQGRDTKQSVSKVLEKLGSFLNADRAYIFRINDQLMSNEFEWCREGVPSEIDSLQNIPLSTIDRWRPSFDRQECVVIANMEEIKDSSPEEYRILSGQSITSMVAAPMEKDGNLAGYLGVDNPPPDRLQNIASLLQTLCYFVMLAYQHAESQNQLSRLSYYDGLTSFYNRNRYIEDTNRLANADIPVGIVYLDVNGLKDINDQYGHTFGDSVLVKCAEKMKEAFEDADFYRIGGDEFVIICPDMEKERFETLVGRLKRVFHTDSLYRAAIGSRWAEKSQPLSHMIADADAEMYEDKKEFYRRNPASKRYRHNSDELLHLSDPEVLRGEIKRNRFIVYLQPKIASADRSAVGAEALIRYRSQSDTLILPGNFLPILEEGESVSQIDFFVFEEVCKKLKSWMVQGKKELSVSVNFSRVSLSSPMFVEKLVSICSLYGISPKYLEIEITETMRDVKGLDMKTLISNIRGAGFAVALDDFGSEYANLSLLSSVEFDVLKLDKTMIDDLVNNPRTRAVVESIVEVCQKLNIRMVAEGIETEEQLKILRSCGVELAQGFLFSKPISTEEYESKYLI